jgi:Zn-dependent protease
MSMNNDPVPPSVPEKRMLPPIFKGAFRLFRFAGVDVYLHWWWFLAAFILIRDRPVNYSSMVWDIVEYVAIFMIVTLHEFGHVFACRSVGGTANRVLLWPLGGLALVSAPARPGANLWTIVAGPLVNVFIAPLLFGLALATAPSAEGEAATDIARLFDTLAWFNVVMLIFNLLPIFPLDGGQILQSLLWFALGRVQSLAIAAGIGLVAAAALLALALSIQAWWLAIMAGFLMLSAFGGLGRARTLSAMSRVERRADRACPKCRSAPPIGMFWACAGCHARLDPFESEKCPKCGIPIKEIICLDCGQTTEPRAWTTSPSEGDSTGAARKGIATEDRKQAGDDWE